MAAPFTHEALFYDDADEFLAGTVPFVRDGLAAGEPVLVALGEAKQALLQGELGADADAVQFADMEAIGRNPARIIPVWRDFVATAGEDGAGVRGVGEPAWPGRSADELAECDHHESLLNLAFADALGLTLLCPYDASAHGDDVLEAARRNHPTVVEHGESLTSEAYLAPELAPSPLEAPLSAPPADAETLSFSTGDLPAIRGLVCEHAVGAGLDRQRTADVVLAVNELASNSMRHADGSGVLRVWGDDVAIHCQVEDAGRLEDPLLGRARPTPTQEYGRGLWLVHQLCDLVQLRSGACGTVARVSMACA